MTVLQSWLWIGAAAVSLLALYGAFEATYQTVRYVIRRRHQREGREEFLRIVSTWGRR